MDVVEAVAGVLSSAWWLVLLAVVVVFYKVVLRLFGAVIIPGTAIGVVRKRWVLLGSSRTLPDGKIIALHGEAGFQADTLAPGLHWGYWPWQYEISVVPFIDIPEGKLGVVDAKDGAPLTKRVFGREVDCDAFQNARGFLLKGGQRGPQIAIIPPGTYRVNTALFSVKLVPVLEIPEGKLGMVTTQDGSPLKTGEIAGREVPGHNTFQDGEAFVTSGGTKGLQAQVMMPGSYYLNPNFATVELANMTEVTIGHACVVIAFVGEPGADVTGEGFKHGNLVKPGQRGVWVEPLDPGMYPINPKTNHVVSVPTTNVVLNWATGKTEAHKLDAKLSTITVRSSDGFTFNLDVSQIIHIPRSSAPKVIARFGSMDNLVTQVLEPTIGNYFRNAAQKSDAISFLKERTQRQGEAREHIQHALEQYDVQAVDTLIGDITPPESLMKTLTDRKLAEQERITYETQREAEATRQALEQSRALANTQAQVVDAERSVQIAEFHAQSAVKKAKGEAEAKTTNAAADAEVTTVTGTAEAGRIKAVGAAEAEVLKRKVESVDPQYYAAMDIFRNLATSQLKLVPDIAVAGGGGSGGPLDVLLAMALRDATKKEAVGK
ncbi:MAG: flotillin family protein [Gemmatimonadetes bacterium]|nr:flotillin family protein [Gemmatimonadota bacterium]MBK7785234.1 flotillin family protein [Gemmatimonadota bacterium]MBK9066680.1 flotillin family protein [Gemmatimonadota bacterium]